MAGILGMCLSTLDSYLHAAGLTVVHDVIRPLAKRNGSNVNELYWTRYATVTIGLIAALLAIYGLAHGEAILSLVLNALECADPLLMIPMFAGMMGLKANTKAFYVALGVTLVAFISSKLLLPDAYTHFTILICLAVNGLTFFGAHYWHHGGFVIEQRKNGPHASAHLWRPTGKGLWGWLKASVPTPARLVAYSQRKVERYGEHYVLFGVFFCINYLFPIFMWPYEITGTADDFMLVVRILGSTLCVLLMVKDLWWHALRPYRPLFWHFTLLYCLPFTSTVMFLLTSGSLEWLVHIATTILFLLLLVDWTTFLVLAPLGVGLGVCAHYYFIGPAQVLFDFDTTYAVAYQVFFGTLIGLLFARRKQLDVDGLHVQRDRLQGTGHERNEQLVRALNAKQRLLLGMGKEGRDALRESQQLAQKLKQAIEKGDTEALKAVQQQLAALSAYLHEKTVRVKDHLQLQVSKLSLDALLSELYQEGGPQWRKPELLIRTQQRQLQLDRQRIHKMLLHSLTYIREHSSQDTPVQVHIEDTCLRYPLDATKQKYRQVSALRFTLTNTVEALPKLQPHYLADADDPLSVPPEQPEELPLVSAKHIATAHYGLAFYHEQGQHIAHSYVIPLQVRQVRDKHMDSEDLSNPLSKAHTDYAGVAEKEGALLLAIQQRAPKVDLKRIGKAVDLIRKYHARQRRKSGEPFYLHPIEVTEILLERTQDEQTLLAALLHDVAEDTRMSLAQLSLNFDATVAKLVEEVTKLGQGSRKVALSKAGNLDKLMQVDPRSQEIKVADRIHNLRTIQGHPSLAKQQAIAEESQRFFVPMAQRLGWQGAAEQLQQLIKQILDRV